jgi:hypothetical protein
MTEVGGSGADGRRSLPRWGVAVLVVTAILATVGWFIDRAADHPAPANAGPKSIIVISNLVVPFDAVPATVVAVTSPRDLVLDIGPAITRPGIPSNIRMSKAPPLPVGRTSVRLARIGPPLRNNCHAAEALQLAESVIRPGAEVMVLAVEETAAGFTVDVWRPDGTDITNQLVAAGAAPTLIGSGGAVTQGGSVAMRAAQDDHRGIWAPCPTPG